jgi:hypothetical protein
MEVHTLNSVDTNITIIEKTHPLEKALFSTLPTMKQIFKPINYTAEPISSIISRNVTIDEPKKQPTFSLIIDDFKEPYLFIEDKSKKFNRIIMSNTNFFGSNGDLDSMISNMKLEIKNTENKINKIKKQQFAYGGIIDDDISRDDKHNLMEINKLLLQFEKYKL